MTTQTPVLLQFIPYHRAQRDLQTVAAVTAGLLLMFTAPVQASLTPAQVAKLLAADGQAGDRFGVSVAIEGNTAVVGAFQDDDNGAESGSVYIFTRETNGVWTEQAKIVPIDGAAGDQFGRSVEISGNTIVVGAFLDDDNGVDSGSAYIFTRDVAGVWTQQAKLLPIVGVAGTEFGKSVSISGDTAVGGADLTPNGSAYVFTRDASNVWTQQVELVANAIDAGFGDRFGSSVAIDGDTALIGAYLDDDNGLQSGSAFVFVRNAADVWTQQAKLLASDGVAEDLFGSGIGHRSVAITGDTAVVGAMFGDSILNGPNTGSAYVFTRDVSGIWTEQDILHAADGAAADRFGMNVSIEGSTILISNDLDDDNNVNSGSAYVFTSNAAGVWTQHAKLLPNDGAQSDQFAVSIAISANTVIVGSFRDDDNGSASGSAYIFNLCAADVNNDGFIDAADLALIVGQWGGPGTADLNGDGVVNAVDLATFLSCFGSVCI